MRFLSPLLLSLYLTAFIYKNAFFVEKLMVIDKGNQLFFNELGIFVIFFVPIFFVMKKVVLAHHTRGGYGIFKSILLIIASLGLIISFLYHVVPATGIYHFPSMMNLIFASDQAFTAWLIAPLIALFI